jgi:hypothetical protein
MDVSHHVIHWIGLACHRPGLSFNKLNRIQSNLNMAGTTPLPSKRGILMKVILILIGVLCLIVAGFYVVFPADQLPSFLPGHEADVARIHYKHGIVAGAAGIVLLVAGWWAGRR